MAGRFLTGKSLPCLGRYFRSLCPLVTISELRFRNPRSPFCFWAFLFADFFTVLLSILWFLYCFAVRPLISSLFCCPLLPASQNPSQNPNDIKPHRHMKHSNPTDIKSQKAYETLEPKWYQTSENMWSTRWFACPQAITRNGSNNTYSKWY